jgi:hypothetical protein
VVVSATHIAAATAALILFLSFLFFFLWDDCK